MEHNKLKNKITRETKLQMEALRRKLAKTRKWLQEPALKDYKHH